MKMKMLKVLGVALVAMASLMVQPAAADPDLLGSLEFLFCPVVATLPGTATVLGVTCAIPAVGIPVTGEGPAPILCGDLGVGDRVKVGCTNATCDTCTYVKFQPVSTESSLKDAGTCPTPPSFNLSNGVKCSVRPTAQVKQSKNFLGLVKPAQPTVAGLCSFLSGATPGVTPGTLEIKCEGIEDGLGVISATKVELKK